MTSTYSSLALGKRPFSFIDGATMVFDWTPIAARYNISPTPQSADARAIASDFIVTGNDMRTHSRSMPEHTNRNTPAPQDGPRHIGQVLRQETLYQGPIPPVEAFAGYERVLPGAADRILKMAENQSGHRQTLERRALTGDLIKAMMGTVLAYITFGGSMAGAVYLLANDKPLYGLATFIAALGAAFGPKIYVDFIQPKARSTSLEQSQ